MRQDGKGFYLLIRNCIYSLWYNGEACRDESVHLFKVQPPMLRPVGLKIRMGSPHHEPGAFYIAVLVMVDGHTHLQQPFEEQIGFIFHPHFLQKVMASVIVAFIETDEELIIFFGIKHAITPAQNVFILLVIHIISDVHKLQYSTSAPAGIKNKRALRPAAEA